MEAEEGGSKDPGPVQPKITLRSRIDAIPKFDLLIGENLPQGVLRRNVAIA